MKAEIVPDSKSYAIRLTPEGDGESEFLEFGADEYEVVTQHGENVPGGLIFLLIPKVTEEAEGEASR